MKTLIKKYQKPSGGIEVSDNTRVYNFNNKIELANKQLAEQEAAYRDLYWQTPSGKIANFTFTEGPRVEAKLKSKDPYLQLLPNETEDLYLQRIEDYLNHLKNIVHNINKTLNTSALAIANVAKQPVYFMPGLGNVALGADVIGELANGDYGNAAFTLGTIGGTKLVGTALKELMNVGKVANSTAPAEINIVNKYRVGNIDKAIMDGVADAKNYYDSGRFVGKAMRNGVSRADAEEFAKWASEGIDDIEFYNGFPERDLVGARVIGENAGAMSDIARNPDGTAILHNGKPVRAVYVNTGSKYSVNHEVGGHNATLNYDPKWSGWNTINGAPEHILPTLKGIMDNANELAALLEPLEEFKNWENTYNYYKSIGHSDEKAKFLADFLHKDTHYKGGAINGYYKLGLEARARWKAGELDMLDNNITLQQLEESLPDRRLLSISDAGWSLFTPKSMKNLYKGMYGVAPLLLGTSMLDSKKQGGKLNYVKFLKLI